MGPLGCISKIGGHMLSTMSVEYCLVEEAVLNPFLELSNVCILSENDSQFCIFHSTQNCYQLSQV